MGAIFSFKNVKLCLGKAKRHNFTRTVQNKLCRFPKHEGTRDTIPLDLNTPKVIEPREEPKITTHSLISQKIPQGYIALPAGPNSLSLH